MSGFKIGDEVVVVNRDRKATIEDTQLSRNGDMLYFVRFDDGECFYYREKDLGLASDFAKDRQLATVKDIRDFLLSDEFMTAFSKKFFSTPVNGGIVALDSVGMAASMDKAKGGEA